MREILFMIEHTQNGYEGRSVKEGICISGESMQLLKNNAELTVRLHFAGKGIPRLLRFRQEEIIPIERPLSEHPWYKLITDTPGCKILTEAQVREIIDYYESKGFSDGDFPYWVTDHLDCTISSIDPYDYDPVGDNLREQYESLPITWNRQTYLISDYLERLYTENVSCRDPEVVEKIVQWMQATKELVDSQEQDVVDPQKQASDLYEQVAALKAQYPNSVRSIESVIVELQEMGETEIPDWYGNPFEDL